MRPGSALYLGFPQVRRCATLVRQWRAHRHARPCSTPQASTIQANWGRRYQSSERKPSMEPQPKTAPRSLWLCTNVSATCILGTTGCPVLGYQGFRFAASTTNLCQQARNQLARMRRHWVPGCSGTPNTGDVLTSYSLTSDGTLTMTSEQDGAQSTRGQEHDCKFVRIEEFPPSTNDGTKLILCR